MMFDSVVNGVYKSEGNEMVNHNPWIGSSITKCEEVMHACNCNAHFCKDLFSASADSKMFK